MEDIKIAKKYIQKANNAKQQGHEFNLNFTSYKNLMRAKKCYFTGELLTTPVGGENARLTDRTIDRVDSSKPYEKGNVVACSLAANRIKGTIESNEHGWGFEIVRKILKKVPLRQSDLK